MSCFANIALGIDVQELDNSPTNTLSQTDHYGCCLKVLLGTQVYEILKIIYRIKSYTIDTEIEMEVRKRGEKRREKKPTKQQK